MTTDAVFRTRRPSWAVGFLLALAWSLGGCAERTPAERLAAFGPMRPVEARLSAFDAYAPCCSGPPADDVADDFERARGVSTRGRSEVEHAEGLYELLWVDRDGAVDAAIRYLEEAASASSDAALWNDLAAAYLTRSEREDDPLDLLHALELVERSLEIDPALPEARFNRALVLEKLYLRDLARVSWEAYLELDATSGWADEALAYLDLPVPPPVGEAWEDAKGVLVAAVEAGDGAKVREVVDRFRKSARQWGEGEVLAEWARALEGKHPASAERHLDKARAVGAALAELAGEHLLADAIEAIDRAADAPERLRRLVDGHLAYARASELAEDRSFEPARAELAQAIELLSPESAFVFRARFLDQRCAGHVGAREESVWLGRELVADVEAIGRYPVVQGRTLWVTGTSLIILGRLGEAERVYLRALERFKAVEEVDSFVAVGTYVAWIHNELGDAREAWRRNEDVLRELEERPLPLRRRLFLDVASFSAAELGELRVASLFADAALAMAREQVITGLAKPDAMATHLWHRAFFRRLLGRTEEAVEDTNKARLAFEQVESEDDRRTLWPEILFEEARSLAPTRPETALARIAEAEEAFETSETAFPVPTLLRERARLQAGRDDLDAAVATLDKAIGILERQRVELERPWHRMSFFDRAGEVYEAKLAIELDRGASREALLGISEQARSRVLLDWLLDLDSTSESTLQVAAERRPPEVSELLARLPPEAAVVSYELLDDRLLTWVVRDGGVDLLKIQDVDLEMLTAEVTAFRESLQRHRRREPDSTALWQLLMAPIQSHITGAESLVIAADGVLHGVPFAALHDVDTKRFLIEDYRLTFVPSLWTLAELDQRPPLDTGSSRFVAVGDPAFDAETFEDLERLKGARAEVATIAGRFANVEVLGDEAATPSAVREKLASADVFHYAGHALANWRLPLRSFLVLAPEPGKPGSGTFLARDVLELDLYRPRLVVLSACETAYGGRTSREGIEGLVWPFLARGVPAVVASLWKVNDKATAQLFDEFYDALAGGADPSEALRSAQIARAAKGTLDWTAFQVFGSLEVDSI